MSEELTPGEIARLDQAIPGVRDLRAMRDGQYRVYRELADAIHDRFCRREDDPLPCFWEPCQQKEPHHHCQERVTAENLAALAWRLHHPLRYRLGLWLPRLDQWLAMLEEAGHPEISFEDMRKTGGPKPGWWATTAEYTPMGRGNMNPGIGPTREEAAARLWCAVTGRMVTAPG